MKEKKLEDIGQSFIDIAEDYDTWNTDFSLSLFRKKLKGIGEKLLDYFVSMDEYINAKIKEVLNQLKLKESEINNKINVISEQSKQQLDESNKGLSEQLIQISNDIKSIKLDIERVNKNIKILDANNKEAINTINLIIRETLDIDEIHGGTALI